MNAPGSGVRPVRADEFRAWDEFVASCPQGTIFHTSLWKRTIEQGYGGEGRMLLLGCFRDGRLVGGCTAMQRVRLGMSMAVMPLVTPYGGYLLPDEGAQGQEVARLLSGGMSERFVRESLVLSPGSGPAGLWESEGYRPAERRTYHLDLTLSPEELWAGFEPSVRRQIRKGERLGLESGDPDLDAAYALFRQTFERRGERCPVGAALFSAVTAGEALRPFRRTFSAVQGGRLLSYVVLLHFGRFVHYAVASTAPEAFPTGVSSLLIWEGLKAFASEKEGHVVFDFVGANIPSIARFKQGFGPVSVSHWRLERFRGLRGRLLEKAASFRRG